MQIKKRNFILILVGVFIAGMLVMGSVCAYIMNSDGFAIRNDSKLQKIQNQIDALYLNEYDSKELKEGIYKGYVEGLEDPYSVYMDANEYASWQASAMGKYSGVGITFANDGSGTFVVLDVYEGSPAAKAGITAGDYILTVDGKSYEDADLMAADIRGEEGSKVTLEIYHNEKTEKFELVRDKITVSSVSSEMLDGNIGYIKITQFLDDTAEEFKDALKDVEQKKPAGLILDLRNNGGGLVDECVEVADEFLDKGVVCYVEDKRGRSETYDAKDGKTDLKTIVLINENSASASEILAGALKDNGFKIVGQNSFGKGIIQTTIEMSDGSALKLTIMQYLSPDKHVIHKKGIKPNVPVEDDDSTEADEQLEKAKQLLQ